MKQKEVEAVFGGKAEFENADRMASKSRGKKILFFLLCSGAAMGGMDADLDVLQHNAPRKAATATVRTSSNCRFEVQTNR